MSDDEVEIESVDDDLAASFSARMSPYSRFGVLGLLRQLVDDLETGVVDANAVLVVLTDAEDVNRPYSRGYKQHMRLRDAITDAQEWHYHKWLFRRDEPWSAEGAAARRKTLRQYEKEHAEKEADDEARAKPYLCACNARFASERGQKQHANLISRKQRDPEPGTAWLYGDDGRMRGSVHLESALKGGWPLAGWAVPLPQSHIIIAEPIARESQGGKA